MTTTIRPAQGTKLCMDSEEIALEFESTRSSRGIWLCDKAIVFVGENGEYLYIMREELSGGSWMNSPRICSS